MKLGGNTVLVTGGGSGIGRGLAEAFRKAGSNVVIAGRRQAVLEDVCAVNPGMTWIVLDIEDADSIAAAAVKLINEYPDLNVVINNAGIMRNTQVGHGSLQDDDLVSTLMTNLLGPIRLTGALIGQLRDRADAAQQKGHTGGATVINVTSGLAFVPLTPVAVYCATKAALHSYTLSLRWELRDSGVRVLELVPPYVQTELYHGADDPRAMPLPEFIDEAMHLLAEDGDGYEAVPERSRMFRPVGAAQEEASAVDRFNTTMAADPH